MKRPSHYVLLCAVAVLVTFSASGHLPIAAVHQPGPASPQVVRLEPAAHASAACCVHGSVLDTMGFWVAGAEVRSGDATGRTDADGQFRLDVRPEAPAAPIALEVLAAGYAPGSLPAWPAAGEALVVALAPSAPWDAAAPAAPFSPPLPLLTGEGVVRGPDGAPVAGALVVVAGSDARARTDDVGRYAIPLPAGGATLVVHSPDGGPTGNGLCARSEPLHFDRDHGVVPLPELQAQPGGALRGTVRGSDGAPCKGVPLQVAGNGLVRTIASGDSGGFRIGGLQPGRYEVRPFAFRGSFGCSRAVELDRPVVDVELRLQAGVDRRVQVVTEQGAPVARAVVETKVDGLRRGIDRADGDGWVQVRVLPRAAQFAVRTADDYRPLRVVDAAPADKLGDRLVVALP
jgi:hypothetical protein